MDRLIVAQIIEAKRPGKFSLVMDAAIDEVEQEILNYCSISEVPDALRFTVANMSIDLLEFEAEKNKLAASADLSEVDLADVSSLKVGDTSINIGESRQDGIRKSKLNSHKSNLDDILMNYRAQLNRYRRLW